MKALKITLALVVVTVLTVSVISKDQVVQDDTTTVKKADTVYNPIAHAKKKRSTSSQS